MPQNPQTPEELRQAMVLAEQTHKATVSKPSVASTDTTLTDEIRSLRSQLSEVQAIQSQQQPTRSHQQMNPGAPNHQPLQTHQRQTNYQRQSNTEQGYQRQQQPNGWKCNFCGGKRFHNRSSCPASNQICQH